MERTILTTDNIIKIIQECALNSVTHFKYESLEISFGSNQIVTQNSPPSVYQNTEQEESVLNNVADEALIQQELELKKRTLEELVLEDPAELERLHSLGELDDRVKDQSE